MSSQDPTPPEGQPITPDDRRVVDPASASDPLWAPTGAQRGAAKPAMPMGTPTARPEPARAPYGQAAPASAPTAGSAEPTMAMASADVPRVTYEPAAYQAQAAPVAYEVRPAEVPVAVESTVVAAPKRKSVWPWVAAVVALILGGVVGWLVSRADDDDEVATQTETTVVVVDDTAVEIDTRLDSLLDQTRANRAYAAPSGFPQIDEIVALERERTAAELQGQVDLLSVAQEQSAATVADLEEQLTTLESSLAEVTAERDELKAQADSGAMSDTEFLARLQEKEDQISTLEDQLATATMQASDAQAASQKASDDLRVAQTELQQARASLQALDVQPIENYVGSDISRIRNEASANGWYLVEQQVEDPQAAPGVIVSQQPAPGNNMIRGSVVYVQFDEPTP